MALYVFVSELPGGRTFEFFVKIFDFVHLHFWQTSDESIFL